MSDEKKDLENTENANPVSGFGIRHLQISMMTLCAIVIYIMRSSMSVAILAMTDHSKANNTDVEIYEWSEEIRGVVLSSFFWGYTAMQIPAGVLGKLLGGKPLLFTSLLLNAVLCLATPALAKIGNWIAVCTVRMCMGMAQACFMPGYHTLLGQWVPPQERTRLSIVAYAGIQLGTVLTMPLCGILSQSSLGWRLIFYTMGVLALCMSVLWWFFTASSPRQHRLAKEKERTYIENSLNFTGKEKPPTPWKKILTSGPLLAAACAHTGMNWCFLMLLVEIPTYLKQGLGTDLASGSSLSALPFLAQWIVASGCSVISDHIYNKKILSLSACRKLFNSIGSIGGAIGLVAMSFLTSENRLLAVIILVYTGGILGCCTCGFMLNHIDLAPNFAGVMFGYTNCIANLIGILAPLSTGFILGDNPSDISRWRIAFCFSAGLIVVADLIFRIFGTSELQPWNEPRKDSEYEYDALKLKLENGTEETVERIFTAKENKDSN